MYISQDPIGLEGGDNLYGYVEDANIFVDVHGLQPIYILDCATARERVIAENGIPKGDITVINGYVKAELVDPNSNIWPQGKSATNDMFCGLTGQLYQINDWPLPTGIAIIADGANVNGPHRKGHHTIYPTIDMSFNEFNQKLQEINTTHVGKINDKKKFVPKCE